MEGDVEWDTHANVTEFEDCASTADDAGKNKSQSHHEERKYIENVIDCSSIHQNLVFSDTSFDETEAKLCCLFIYT